MDIEKSCSHDGNLKFLLYLYYKVLSIEIHYMLLKLFYFH